MGEHPGDHRRRRARRARQSKTKLTLKPQARFADGVTADHFDLLLDGQKIRDCPAGGTLEFDTNFAGRRAHELRIVAASIGPVVARGEKIIEFTTANHGRTIEVTCAQAKKVSRDKPLLVTVKSPQSMRIHLLCGTRLLGNMEGDEGQVEIPAASLGLGPVRLEAVGLGSEGPRSNVFARPLEITVE